MSVKPRAVCNWQTVIEKLIFGLSSFICNKINQLQVALPVARPDEFSLTDQPRGGYLAKKRETVQMQWNNFQVAVPSNALQIDKYKY